MEVISRKEARGLGLLRYYTGVPCKKGHTVERWVSNEKCVECQRINRKKWRDENPDRNQEIEKKRDRKRHSERVAKNAMRRAKKQKACPKWADIAWIVDKYVQRSLLSTRRVVLHVDHYIPLNHPLVCGLHNQFNIRIITKRLNLEKGNRFNSDEYELLHPLPETSYLPDILVES